MRALITALFLMLTSCSESSEPVIISGNSSLTTKPQRVHFSGIVAKQKTQDPRVLGGAAILTNLSGAKYRVVSLEYSLDHSEVRKDETVESDIGLTILPQGQSVSLNSGEEMLVSHEYYVPGDKQEKKSVAIPAGGFEVPSGMNLTIGSVSGFYPNAAGQQTEIPDDRLASGKLMTLHYDVELIRDDLVREAPVSSYRSPFRDRGTVVDPNRSATPSTAFKNSTGHDIKVHGIGFFLSALSSTTPSSQRAQIIVNGIVVKEIDLGVHVPQQRGESRAMIDPFSTTLKPGDTIEVRGRVDVGKASVYDFAAFLVADAGLVQSSENLDTVQKVDFNGDGFPDIVDVTGDGSIWVALRVGAGLQDTGDEWLRHIGDLQKLMATDVNGDGTPDLVATNDKGLCINLVTYLPTTDFIPSYCDDKTAIAPDASIVWGDFNGDGFPDRLRADPATGEIRVALGQGRNLGAEKTWLHLGSAISRMFPNDGDGDGRTDIYAETPGGPIVLRSTGIYFRATVPSAP